MEVTFYGTYDKTMFLQAVRLTEKQSVWAKVFRYFALGLSVLIIGGTLYLWLSESLDQSDLSRIGRNIITALIFGYYAFSDYISRQRLVKKLFRSGPERTMQGNASHEGISLGPKDGKVMFKWEQFISKGEQGPILALMTTDGSVAVFHRDFFATENDWQHFKQLANQRVIEPQ